MRQQKHHIHNSFFIIHTSQKILVTGGSGFIGTNLILELKNQRFDVVNLSRHDSEAAENLKLDLINDDLTPLDDYKFDYVVHLAAVSSIRLSRGHEEETMGINLKGTKKLLEYFSQKSLKKFISMSSVTVYDCERSAEMAESSELINEERNAYSYSKLLAERECQKYEEKVPLIIFRLANAYGTYQRVGDRPNLIPQIIWQALQEGKIQIDNGDFARDFIYISDITSAIIQGLKSDFTGTLNLGTGKLTKVGDIAKAVAEKLDIEVTDLKRKIDAPLELVPNITRIKEKLNWEPKVSLEEGLKKTIEYYANNRDL